MSRDTFLDVSWVPVYRPTFVHLSLFRCRSLSHADSFLSPHITDGIELMFVGIGLITVPLAVILYTRINAQRDALEARLSVDSEKAHLEGEKGRYGYTPQELRDMGDRAPDFRYMT
jgi:hypothetical protein